jgi:hypothetical protein
MRGRQFCLTTPSVYDKTEIEQRIEIGYSIKHVRFFVSKMLKRSNETAFFQFEQYLGHITAGSKIRIFQ